MNTKFNYTTHYMQQLVNAGITEDATINTADFSAKGLRRLLLQKCVTVTNGQIALTNIGISYIIRHDLVS